MLEIQKCWKMLKVLKILDGKISRNTRKCYLLRQIVCLRVEESPLRSIVFLMAKVLSSHILDNVEKEKVADISFGKIV